MNLDAAVRIVWVMELGHKEVFALDGSSVPVASLWQSGPTLFVFLRHYG